MKPSRFFTFTGLAITILILIAQPTTSSTSIAKAVVNAARKVNGSGKPAQHFNTAPNRRAAFNRARNASITTFGGSSTAPAEYMWKTDITVHILVNSTQQRQRGSWCQHENILSLLALVHVLTDHPFFIDHRQQLIHDTKIVALKYGDAFNRFRSVRGSGIHYSWDYHYDDFAGYRVCPLRDEVGRFQAMAHRNYECEAGVSPATDPIFSFGYSFVEKWRIFMDGRNRTRFCNNNPTWFLGLENDHLAAVRKYVRAIVSEKGVLDADIREKIPAQFEYTTRIGANTQVYAELCGSNRSVINVVEASEASCLMKGFPYGGQNPVRLHALNVHGSGCIGTGCVLSPPWRYGDLVPTASSSRSGNASTTRPRRARPRQPIAVRLAPRGEGRVKHYIWDVEYISGRPDGVLVSHILAINGKFPGPTIHADAGDTLEILVRNLIQDGQNTTLHWHGIHQRGTPFEDGPSNIVQCPIKARTDQTYRFKVEQPGTYWYHSHVKSQYTEGLWGLLIVHPETESTDYDGEFSVTINEWYHKQAIKNEEWFLSEKSQGSPPYPDSILMNGVGRYDCRKKERVCNSGSQLRPVFRLHDDGTYKMRVLNVGGWAEFTLHVEGHRLLPVEADGLELSGRKAFDHAQLGPGQRYAFRLIRDPNYLDKMEFRIIVHVQRQFLFRRADVPNINPYPEALIGHAIGYVQYISPIRATTRRPPTTTPGHYYIPAKGDDVRVEAPPNHVDVVPEFRQFGYNDLEPGFLQTMMRLEYLDEGEITTANVKPAPAPVDREITLNITFALDNRTGIRRGSFNFDPSFLPEGEPLLARAINGHLFPENTKTVTVGYGQVVQIVVNNLFEGAHPIHLHGHHFWIVGMGREEAGVYRPGVDRLDMSHTMRDTVMVRARTWIVIRFRADNPGVWTLHCHIDWHNLSGMMLSILEAQERLKNMTIPEEAKRVCRHHGINIDPGHQQREG